MALQKVMIIGATGNVGSELVKQIEQLDGDGHQNPTQIVGLANSKGYMLDRGGIEHPHLLIKNDMLNRKIRPYAHLHELIDATQKAGLSGEIVFIDVTAERTPEMFDLHREIVKLRQKMVTANKNPLAQDGTNTFEFLTADRRLYRYNPSVMAGGDAIPYLQDARDLSEPVRSLSGCFSGTLGYISSELEKGKKFSSIVREAKKLGFTEPHPWDDLNGFDVARKLLILARSAGFEVDMKDINVEPFIPAAYGEITEPDAFLENLRGEDEAFHTRVENARGRKAVLRYIAEMSFDGDRPSLSVGLKEVPKDSSIGGLSGTANIIEIVSDLRASPSNPHTIKCMGAGVPKTAAAVRADLLSMLSQRKHV